MNAVWKVGMNPFIEHTASVEGLPWNFAKIRVFASSSVGKSIINLGIASKGNVLVCRSAKENPNHVQFPLEDLENRVAKFNQFDHTTCNDRVFYDTLAFLV